MYICFKSAKIKNLKTPILLSLGGIIEWEFNFMIGIYKITSPKNRVYIGQSINIEYRWKKYKNLECKKQIGLYNSFLKYNIENHIFEVIEECNIELLNERERYYQDFYNVLKNGLNCKLTKTNDKSGKLSIETKNKIKLSLIGKKRNVEIGKKIGLKLKGRKRSIESINKSVLNNKNYKHSEETKLKISNSNKGKKGIFGVNHYSYGKKLSEEHKEKIKITSKLRKVSDKTKKLISDNSTIKKKVMDIESKIIYNSITEVEKIFNLKLLGRKLNNKRKNNTKFILI